MRPVAGLYCIHCGRRIESDAEGRLCEACTCPVHLRCARPAPGVKAGVICSACATSPEQARHEEGLLQQIERDKDAAINPHNMRRRVSFIGGIIIFGFMALRGLLFSLDGELHGLLVFGLIGFGVSLGLFLWSRPPKQ
jgi:hypothetical protein